MNTTSRAERLPASGQPGHAQLFAALDLGTNNCRLLIAGRDKTSATHYPPSLKVVDSFSRIVRLGEGVSKSGKLSEAAMQRTLAALAVCKRKLDKYSIVKMRLVATEACRKASNTQEFFKRVQDELGLFMEVINNEEEARLAFLGCSSLLNDGAHRAIVFDIGGGSTELMWIDKENASSDSRYIADWLSIDSGVMNLADRFGGSSFSDLAYKDMVDYITARIEPFNQVNRIGEVIGNAPVQMLSTSGTVTTLAAIHLGLPKYDRNRVDGIRLEVNHLHRTIKKLLDMRPSERFNHPCIGHDRADYIISGCAIFEAISNTWPTGEITIADRGVREGIIISLMQS